MKLPRDHPLRPFEFHGVRFEGQSGDQYYGTCPFTDKPGKFYVNPKNLLWDSKTANKSGNLKTFFKEIAILNLENTTLRDIKRLALSRGLMYKTINKFNVGFDGIRYTIPVSNFKGTCVDIRHYKLGRSVMSSPGGTSCLLNGQVIAAKNNIDKPIYICEGEWDCMALYELARKAKELNIVVVGAPGASTFKDEWVDIFHNRDVVLCYDNDDAGIEGELRAYNKLRSTAKSIRCVHWEDDRPNGYDIRDFVIHWKEKKQPKTGLVALEKLLQDNPRGGSDTQTLLVPSGYPTPVNFETVEEVFRKWMYLDTVDGVRVMLATIISNMWEGDPLWIFLVAPPGGSKTETLNSLSLCGGIHLTSSLTPRALISGMTLQGNRDPSLIPKLDGKTLVIKDFTAIMGMRDADKEEIFGILRDAYDGKCAKDFGNGITRSYESRFSLLAAVTPAIYAEGSRHTALGERFLKFTMADNLEHHAERDIIRTAIRNVNIESDMRFEMADVVRSFLSFEYNGTIPTIPEPILEKIIELSKLASRARASVIRNQFRSDLIEGRPSSEIGSRIGKQLAKLSIALAAVDRREVVTEDDLRLLKRVVIDTIPQRVEDIIRFIYRESEEVEETTVSTKEIALGTGYPLATVARLLGDFTLLKIVNRYGSGTKFRFALNDYITNSIRKSCIYSGELADRERLRYTQKKRKVKKDAKKTSGRTKKSRKRRVQ